ncbi:ubiquitin-like-conjugating enzyme ATG10 [Fopius arisanus]|uniref:Ubiquitin-like-conjugating enzyme ATG10 n=1 Tax=Fopius arisanus TaxID=64838 RepID=A0A9R1T904_9HYME|nr:PREDICTED: ubiquitin-like-conjugating enzyme ATG10 [Fopius arisanus]XP_011304896.1 PREDICTED: ubiquitin-like-conjugating enzyme ATG10 [Fopius arisanus]XP_011304897.1 PREDICTED: ubiquitin-like-conjugating enzyme ATG10 [Fopius arisanus]XP_011304898.1 PREDICTED: ubiquitin-like-conjugating enzyme ATG10 [Fopius arisanus]
MDGPGTLSWDEFLIDAKSLVRVSNEISDSWELRGDERAPGQAYLCRKAKTFISSNLASALSGIYPQGLENYKIVDDPFEAKKVEDCPMCTEHHVLWSMSYGVPVLYFNAWISDFPGVNAVTVESIQNLVQQGVGYNELSQAMHPIEGTTFLQFHPCLSGELIQNTSMSKNKLVSWLSTVAPCALNLKLDPKYFNLTLEGNGKG